MTSFCLLDELNRFLIHHNMPDHSISPFPHESNLRVKNHCVSSVAVFKITRLLTS